MLPKVVFLIFPIHARLQSEIIKILMLSNLTCDTDIGAGQPVIRAMPRIQQFLIKLHLEVKKGQTTYHPLQVHCI